MDKTIAEILLKKTQGTKLYSPIGGECWLENVVCFSSNPLRIRVKEQNGEYSHFDKDGTFKENGEVMLFPSNSMRTWERFSWEEGDFLTANDKYCQFNGWCDDEYTRFWAKDVTNIEGIHLYSRAEERTLDWEKASSLAAIFTNRGISEDACKAGSNFEPFQKVLYRNNTDEIWRPAIFGYYDTTNKETPYCLVGIPQNAKYCLPYNERSKCLLGKDIKIPVLKRGRACRIVGDGRPTVD